MTQDEIVQQIRQNAMLYADFCMNITGFNRPIIETAVVRCIVISFLFSVTNPSINLLLFTLVFWYLVPIYIVVMKRIFDLIYVPTLFALLAFLRVRANFDKNDYSNIYSSVTRYFSITIKVVYYFYCISFLYNLICRKLFDSTLNMATQNKSVFFAVAITLIIIFHLDWNDMRIKKLARK